MIDCGKIGMSLTLATCAANNTGVEPEVILFNRSDILRVEYNGERISNIILKAGTNAYRYNTYKNGIDTQVQVSQNSYLTTFTHSVAFRSFIKTQNIKRQVNALANARVVAIVENVSNYDAEVKYEVYGLHNGLVLTELQSVSTDAEGVVYAITLSSEEGAEESQLPLSFFDTSTALTEDNIDTMVVGPWYGVQWDTTVSNSAKTRIGSDGLNRALPIQNRMRGCLLNDNGDVVEYLTADNWNAHTLDGTNGQVMVEIPLHYRKFEQNGTTRRCMISEYPLPGYHCVPKMYISAYEATLQRSTATLASVMSEDADYRGGNNNADWDGTYRSVLGRPATFINRTNFRNYARKRKSSTTEWNCQDYNAYKAVFWLFVVEYANSNCQLAFNAEKDANGYAQGGLGNGITTVNSTAWSEYNGYYPFVPCGHTNELGNGSGEVAYEALNEDGSVWATVYANRYRGIENPFGHIWKWTDGINIKISPTEENGGDNTSKVYVADNPANYNDTGYDGYAVQGLEARTEGYVRQLVFGEQGDIMPAVVGGGSTTYWADYHYTIIPTSEALLGVLFGGSAGNGAYAGFGYAGTRHAPSNADATIGSRLCFIPQSE